MKSRHDNPPPFPSDRQEQPEGNGEVISKGPCPKCDTEYGNVTYADGHAHCFACKYTTPRPTGAPRLPDAPPKAPSGAGGLLVAEAQSLPWAALTQRGVTATTRKKYGYFTAGFNGQSVHVAPYYDQSGELAGQKLRFPDKSFAVVKAAPGSQTLAQCRLFGHQVYGDRYDRQVVVTEGELDAMSVAQVLDFKVAVVSINIGAAGAAKCLKANYLWLDRYADIVLWLDDDEPGRAASAECAQLFAVGKVRIAKVPGFKDASDVLQAGKPGDIQSAIYMATAWRPPGIVNAADSVEDVTAPKADDAHAWSYDWPWAAVQDYLGPILPGQVTYHVAGTGIGKTTGMAEVEYGLITQGCKVAHMGFEDTRREVKLRLLSIHLSDRLDLRPRGDEEMRGIHRDLFDRRLVELFDPETAEWTVDAILGYVRYCAKALDCRVIVIDPLTFIAAGLSLGDDERRALDKASRDLAALAKELAVNLQVAHHLTRPAGKAHEEGAATSLNQVRGSGGIANFASSVIGHERNQQETEGREFLVQLRALKNRPRSRTGPMLTLRYDINTGRLKETDEPFPTGEKQFPPHASNSNTDY